MPRNRTAPNGRPWLRYYRMRINLGLEHCRNCGIFSEQLQWGHIVAHKRGGPFTQDNITILCKWCNRAQGQASWFHLPSLRTEHSMVPPCMSATARVSFYPNGDCQYLWPAPRATQPSSLLAVLPGG